LGVVVTTPASGGGRRRKYFHFGYVKSSDSRTDPGETALGNIRDFRWRRDLTSNRWNTVRRSCYWLRARKSRCRRPAFFRLRHIQLSSEQCARQRSKRAWIFVDSIRPDLCGDQRSEERRVGKECRYQ